MKNYQRPACFLILIALAGIFAGCASAPATGKAKEDKEEYVSVMTTGSNIPVRIKKSDLAAGKVAKGTLADSVSAEDFQNSLRPLNVMNPAGGK